MKKLTISALCGAVFAVLLAIPAVAAAKASAIRKSWPPETMSGKIATVEPDRKLLVIKSPDGVPFDMVITPKTRIKSGNQTLALKDLMQYPSKDVSVKFVPERRGDVAQSIRIGR